MPIKSSNTLDWNRLKIFHMVAEAGSFTEAGRRLRLSQSAVSRQVSALEKSLSNVQLFHRHARGLALTEHGQALFETAQELVSKLSATQGLLMEQKDKAAGTLRIAATIGMGTTWLSSRIGLFCQRYPEINLELRLSDYPVDLTRAEADVAIQMTAPNQPGLVQRPFATINLAPYASEEYIRNYGMPQHPKDLDKHILIVYGPTTPALFNDANWLLSLGREDEGVRHPRVYINSNLGMLNACAGGAGIASLPNYLAAERPNLICVLSGIEGPKIPTYYVYPEALRNSKRIHVLREFLLEQASLTEF
ncbi:MAG: LysR family transcriptional regulator [Alphaproteobacteria bacterium]|nr:MAG: LysR family transcriptional regulator [Alphaproteobacteria bacterium]